MSDFLPSLLHIDKLNLSFKNKTGLQPVLKSLSFNIFPGETLALVGESGSGKSMTALAIMQLLPSVARVNKDSRIVFKQQDLLALSQRAIRKVRGRQMSIVFQNAMSAFNPVLTIGYQLHEVLHCHFNLSRRVQKERILALLNEVGIERPGECYQAYPHELSGGMRQRALIAMALAGEPELLIADEPTTALDVTVQAQVLDTLKAIQSKRRMSILFISHDLGVVSRVADKVAVLYKGEIIERASKADFFRSPQNVYSQKLFAALASSNCNSKSRLAIREKESADKHPLLKVENLSVYFSKQKIKVIQNINFSLKKGRTLALIGESGSGKTTTAKAILQLLTTTSGSIYFKGQLLNNLNYSSLKNIRKNIQVIFQDSYSALNPRMLISSSLEEGMIVQGINITHAERSQRINDLLITVGLSPDFKDRYPNELSGGERQRVCIARALALEPQLLICDEPTSALDVSVQGQILTLLRELQEKRGLAYLLITHNFSVVNYLADEVAVMYQGRIIEYGPKEKILLNPQQEYTKKLLNSVLII